MNKYYIATFGCQMNVHDSEKISGTLTHAGLTQTLSPEDADFIIINTCSIRQKAEDKFYSLLGRLKNIKDKKPTLKFAITGCIAQKDGKAIFKRAPFVDFVIGNQNINVFKNLNTLSSKSIYDQPNSDISDFEMPSLRNSKISAYINIMYGCNNFCSYCVVPYTRGSEKSRATDNIINEIQHQIQTGAKEIVLLGQNVNSYRDKVDFAGLLLKINELEGDFWIRFVTSHPKDLNDNVISAFSDLNKVCKHIHLPLQSGSDRILSLMNRKYTFAEYYEKVCKLRENNTHIAITTDIISGFPTETDIDHQKTLTALEIIKFDGIFAFKYSPRDGTVAAKMQGHLSNELKSERLSQILILQNTITEQINKSLIGTQQIILLDTYDDTNDNIVLGRTSTNKIVSIENTDNLNLGDFKNVIITNAYQHSLQAIIN